jgi:hypothetical protein
MCLSVCDGTLSCKSDQIEVGAHKVYMRCIMHAIWNGFPGDTLHIQDDLSGRDAFWEGQVNDTSAPGPQLCRGRVTITCESMFGANIQEDSSYPRNAHQSIWPVALHPGHD